MSLNDYCPICNENVGKYFLKEHLTKYSKEQLIIGILTLNDEYQDSIYESWGEDN